MTDNSCLVTGASGFLGGYVVRRLRDEGMAITTLGRHPVAEAAAHVDADLRQPFSLPAPVELVFHVAGRAHVTPKTEDEKEEFMRVNVTGTENLLQALTPSPPRAFVLVSTVAVYGAETGADLDEEGPLAALDAYGVSKRLAEERVLAWGDKHGVRIGIARLPLLAGRRPPGNLGRMIRAIRKGRYLSIGDAAARRSLAMAGDVAATLPILARVGGTFHLTDGRHPTFGALERALAEAMNVKPPRRIPRGVANFLARVGDVGEALTGMSLPFQTRGLSKMTSTLTFSDARARRDLGWSPRSVVDAASELVS